MYVQQQGEFAGSSTWAGGRGCKQACMQLHFRRMGDWRHNAWYLKHASALSSSMLMGNRTFLEASNSSRTRSKVVFSSTAGAAAPAAAPGAAIIATGAAALRTFNGHGMKMPYICRLHVKCDTWACQGLAALCYPCPDGHAVHAG
eukprot:357723-Chlamydomonas_euryale.AAC.25